MKLSFNNLFLRRNTMNVTVNFENFLSDSSIGSSGESRKDVSKIVEKLELLARSTGGDDFNINVKISYIPTKES